jgi:pyridoxal phosphate enzyme (YggS family)
VIAERAAAIRERIARAAARAGRSADEVRLVAVSKTVPAEVVAQAFAAGLTDFGENRVQEAEGKIATLGHLREKGMRWHLIGHLQSNKARRASTLFDCIESIDSLDLGLRLGRLAEEAGRVLPVFVQVDLASEATKFGLPEREVLASLEALRGCSGLRTLGLMLLPPFEEDPELTRPFFRRLRQLRDQAADRGLLEGRDLSMGMSHDFEVAIEEGATLVRVGSALFGERPPLASGVATA